MATNYSKTSPYADTDLYGTFLDIANIPAIPMVASDVGYEIDAIYKHRPDLLAYDLYGDQGLWWVFAVRNPNVIQDPVYDFEPGVRIFIPQKQNLISALGI